MRGQDFPLVAAEGFHSPETERAVLACVLLDPGLLEEVLLFLPDEGSFGGDRERRVFRAMLRLHEAHEPIDLRTLQRDLEARGELERAGGVAALSELDLFLPDPGRCEAYCRAVKRDSIRRQVARLARLVLDRLGKVENPADVHDELLAASRLLDESIEVQHESYTLGEMLEVAAARYEGLRTGARPPGLRTGFPRVDAAVVGFAPRDFVVIAGYAGSGKTTLTEQLVYDWADAGERVMMISLEMGHAQTEDRFVARGVGSPLVYVRQGQFDRGRLSPWMASLAQSGVADRLRFAFPRTAALPDLLTAARAMHRRHPASVVVIDHLHRIRVPGLERRFEVDLIARELKQLGIELDVPVIAPAQLSRAGAKGRPRLWDLAESAGIEREADVVLMIYRPERGPAELYVEKARQGEAGPDACSVLYFDQRTRVLREQTGTYTSPTPGTAPPRRTPPVPDPNLRALEEALG